MRRLLLFLSLLAVVGTAYAQETNPKRVYLDNGKLYDDGTALSCAQVMSIIDPEIFCDTYEGAERQYWAGYDLLIAGTCSFVAGMAMTVAGMLTYNTTAGQVVTYSGIALAACGDIAVAVGSPLYCIGKGRLEWIVRDYNKKQSFGRAITLAPASRGIGVSVRF